MILKIYRGDSSTIEGTVRNQDGDVVNITGATIRFSAKKRQTDTAYVITKNATISDPVNGVFNVTLSPTDTNIPPGEYIYDIELAFSASQVHTVAKDTLSILTDITI